MTKSLTFNGISLPEFLFNFDNIKSKNISPAASFDPNSAISGEAWQNATSPSNEPLKKLLILDQSSFSYNINYGIKIALIARLKNAGFKIVVKVENGFCEVEENLKDLKNILSKQSKFNEDDYQLIAQQFNIASNKSVLLSKKEWEIIKDSMAQDGYNQGNYEGDSWQSRFRYFSTTEILKSINEVQEDFKTKYLKTYLRYCDQEQLRDIIIRYQNNISSCTELEICLFAIKNIANSKELAESLINNHHDKITDVKELSECIEALKGSQQEGLIVELINNHQDKITSGWRLSKCIRALKGSSQEEFIVELINKYQDKITNGKELSNCIKALKGSQQERLIVELINKYQDKITNGKELSYCIKALKGSSQEELIVELINNHHDKITNGSKLSKCIEALKGSSQEELIVELINNHQDKITSESKLSYCIKALKGSSQELLIVELIKNHQDKIINGWKLSECVEALKGLSQGEVIVELIKNHQDKITDGCQLSYCIEALKGSSQEDFIVELINKHQYKITDGYHQISKCIKALKGSSQEWLIVELINNNQNTIISNLSHCIEALKGSSQEWLMVELINKYQDKVANQDEKFSGLYKYIEALKGSSQEEFIVELIKNHQDKIISGGGLSDCIKALKGSPQEGLIVELIHNHQHKIINLNQLSLVIKNLKDSPQEDLISQLMNNYKGETHYQDILRIVYSLKGTLCEDLSDGIFGKYLRLTVQQPPEDLIYELVAINKSINECIDDKKLESIIDSNLITYPNLLLFYPKKEQILVNNTSQNHPTYLYIAALNNRDQLDLLLKRKNDFLEIVSLDIAEVTDSSLLSELLKILPKIQNLTLPEKLKDSVKEIESTSIDFRPTLMISDVSEIKFHDSVYQYLLNSHETTINIDS